MKKIIGLLITSMAFTGCMVNTSEVGNNEVSVEVEVSEEVPLEEFNIVLDWYPNAVHGFIYEAIEKGYYLEEGLEVNVQFPSNTNDALSLTAAGKADAGIYYMHHLVEANVNQDVPVVSLGAITAEPLSVFLSLSEKNITSAKDLVGKKIGAGGSELSEKTIAYILEQENASFDDVEMVNVGFDLMSSMTTGNVDVTYGCMVNHEVPHMEKEGFEVNYFYPHDYGIPTYYELILVTGEDTVNNNSEKLEKFIRASKKGFEDMKNNPEEAVDILLANQNAENFPLDKGVEMESINILLPVMASEEFEFLSQDEQLWEENINWLYENEMIDEKVDVSEVIANLN